MSTALVTGSARGIGLELCRQLKERGDTVIAGCRRPSDDLKALDVDVIFDPKVVAFMRDHIHIC